MESFTVQTALILAIWFIVFEECHGESSSNTEDYRLVIGIVCDESKWKIAQDINDTWRQKLQLPIEMESGSKVKVHLDFLKRTTSQTLSSANDVKRVLQQRSISMVIGPDELIYRLATADQHIPYLITGSVDENRHRSGSGYGEDEDEEKTGKHDSQSSPSPSHSSNSPASSASPTASSDRPPSSHRLLLRLLPQSKVLHRAVADVVQVFKWENVAVIYDSDEGLELIGLLMDETSTRTNVTVRGRRLRSRVNETCVREQLAQLRFLQIRHIVVACKPEMFERLLSAALRLSMLSLRYSWIFVHPLPTSVNFEPYSYTGVNFSAFSLVTLEDSLNLKVTAAEADEHLTYSLIHDALHLVTLTLKSSAAAAAFKCSSASTSECSEKSLDVAELLEYMRQTSANGLTGRILFDATGSRKSTAFTVLALNSIGLEEIGEWHEAESTPSKRLRIKKWTRQDPRLSTSPLQRGLQRVVTLIDPPFVMLKKNHQNLTGNSRFEGFLIDLFDQIAERLQFQYELYESPDGNYGSKNEAGEWNGMIKELIIGNASMCLGAISITSDREQAVDFSKPFKQKMFNLLMKKPEEISTIFQFLYPLSGEVWLAILSSLVLVSLLLFLMDRFSPNFPVHPRAAVADADMVGFNLNESIWFMYGAMVGGGTEGWHPRRVSGRLLTSAWWFFGLIIISSYTANLAAFLTVTRIETPIKSIADLAMQSQIRYGTVRNTYAMTMFKNSQLEILQKMWFNMGELHADWLVGNTEEGIQKAKEGDYAFIWDAPINKHIAMHDCALISTGEPFDEKGYGIGMPIGASYRDDITMEILSLGEKGEIVKMENRWWSGGKCAEFSETSTGNNEKLTMFNVAGVFLLLAIGAILAAVACSVEFVSARFIKARRKRENNTQQIQDKTLSSLTEGEMTHGV